MFYLSKFKKIYLTFPGLKLLSLDSSLRWNDKVKCAGMTSNGSCHSSEGWNPVFEKAERIILKSLKIPLI